MDSARNSLSVFVFEGGRVAENLHTDLSLSYVKIFLRIASELQISILRHK